MKANARVANSNDEGVSPVIAVILMVAITVVLAATVYVWVSGFASDSQGPEEASATAQGLDLNDDGDVEWIKLTLVRGENAPYSAGNDTQFSVVNPDGSSNTFICQSADMNVGLTACVNPFTDAGAVDDDWSPGQTLYIPCDGTGTGGNMAITAAVRGTTILDSSVGCDADAT